jgi:DNA polymerase-3 subunit alpha
MITDFSSLHSHSHFSVYDGICTPEEMVLKAKEKGLRSIAITDHGHTHAHADFYLSAKKHGVRAILGIEAYLIPSLERWRQEKEGARDDEESVPEEFTRGKAKARALHRKSHLVLLARNRTGLANLYRLSFRAHKEGFYGKPRADKRMLAEHAEGLCGSTACMGGIISNRCWDFKRGECSWEDVVREALEYDEIMGRGNLFLELQFNESEGQRFINECMVRISQETGMPLTVTADSHYANPEDWEAQEILYMLRSKLTVKTRGDDWDFGVKQLYVKSAQEMWDAYLKFGKPHGIDEATALRAFEGSLALDALVEQFEPDTHQRLPTLPYENPFLEMGQRAVAGLKALGLGEREEYQQRLLRELKVIKEKGIANYFLIVRDIIAEAKRKMLVGAGRGSARSSTASSSSASSTRPASSSPTSTSTSRTRTGPRRCSARCSGRTTSPA